MQTFNRQKNKINLIIIAIIVIVALLSNYIKAANILTPDENQYLELRATQIIDTGGNEKQLVMELWGHNLEFKGFNVRFEYNKENYTPSNILTNEETSNEQEYFKFEPEFENSLDLLTLQEGENVIKAALSFNSYDIENEHIIKDDEGKCKIVTGENVLIGKMSFKMNADEFDISGFKLVTSSDSPTTGIKIMKTITDAYEEQSTFRFTDQTASKDATLSSLIISSGEKNLVEPEKSTYKEYTLTPEFTAQTLDYELVWQEYLDDISIVATQNDENASMKIIVPKRDEKNEVVLDYEEIDLSNNVPFAFKLNNIGSTDTIIKIKVTAEDGKTTSEYNLTIKRPYATIKGTIYTEPTSFTTGTHKANIFLYLDSDVQGKVDWEEAANNSAANKRDSLNTTFRGDGTISNSGITYQISKETEDDGTFSMYIIPGTYVLLIDKQGYLDRYYINVEAIDGQIINLNERETRRTYRTNSRRYR